MKKLIVQQLNNEPDWIPLEPHSQIKPHHKMFFGFVRTTLLLSVFANSFFDLAKRLSEVLSSPRQSLRNAAEGSLKKVLPGVVVTSSRSSRRRISSVAATQAFAVATSGESPKFTRKERLASTPGRLLLLYQYTHVYLRWNVSLSTANYRWKSSDSNVERTKNDGIYHCEHRFNNESFECAKTLAYQASIGMNTARVRCYCRTLSWIEFEVLYLLTDRKM